MIPGLKPLKEKRFWEKKDFSHKKTLGSFDVSQLPKEYNIASTILNQFNSNKCTAYMACAVQESEHRIGFDPDWFYFQEGVVEGEQSDYGYDLRTCMKTGVKKGFKPLNGEPPENYKESSYFRVDDPYNATDLFDDIRIALWIARDERRTICAGVDWRDNWNTTNGIIPKELGKIIGGHAIKFTGFETIDGIDYLIAQNSYGLNFGYNGLHYFPREVVNRDFSKYGVFAWRSKPNEEQIKTLLSTFDVIINALPEAFKITFYEIKIQFIKILANMKDTSLLEMFCEGIKEHEGYFKGSRSYRNNNPGNIKCSQPFEKSLAHELGATSQDKDNFAVFPNYNIGFQALKQFVFLACTNKLRAYRGDMTIKEFFNIYAPSSDNNDPNRYALVVARKLGIDINNKIKVLL